MTHAGGIDVSSLIHRSFRALALLATMLAGGCRYDLSRLRGHDATVDESVSDDVVNPVDATDILDAISPPDAHDVPDALMTTCTSRPTPNPADVGTRIGASLVLSGDTTGALSLLTPPTIGDNCTLDYSLEPSPEIVYRYVVEHGPRLYATTDAPACTGVFDTIVYARTSCEMSSGTVLACNDDDMVINGCSSCPNPCPRLASSTMIDNLFPGQVIFIVVDGYMRQAGRFRLVLTENAALNAPFASFGQQVDRCGCPDALDSNTINVAFPAPGDAVVSATGGTRMSQTGDRLTGMRRLTFSHIAGVALDMRLASNGLLNDARCQSTRATVELYINNVIVHAFNIDARAAANAPFRVAYQTFLPIVVPTGFAVQITLRLREIVPANCGSIEFDRTVPGTLTLLGH